MNKSQLASYLSNNKMDVQRSKGSLFICDTVFNSYVNSKPINKASFNLVFCCLDWKKLQSFYQMISEADVDRLAQSTYLDYLKDPKSLDEKIQAHQKLTKELDKEWNNYLSQAKQGIFKKEILGIYNKMAKISANWWRYGAIGEDKGRIIELEIIPRFADRHRITVEKAREIVNVLSHPKEQAVFNLERISFLKICLDLIKKSRKQKNIFENLEAVLTDERLNEKVNDYLNKFFWIKTDFYEVRKISPRSLIKEALSEISKRSANEISQELKSIDSGFKKIEEQKKDLLKNIVLSKEDKADLYFAVHAVNWIDQRKLGMMKQIYYLFNIIDEIAKMFHLSYHAISSYLSKEIENLLIFGKRLSGREIKRRQQRIFMSFERGKKLKIFYGDDAEELLNIAIRTEEKEIKGTVASATKEKIIRGKVRIVLDPKTDIFKKGEILITSMTRVEYLPLMRMAAAIITDEGGLACHAAIVSRELGITAIIGTKVATRILKNGNLVEIDSAKGIVKIIK